MRASKDYSAVLIIPKAIQSTQAQDKKSTSQPPDAQQTFCPFVVLCYPLPLSMALILTLALTMVWQNWAQPNALMIKRVLCWLVLCQLDIV